MVLILIGFLALITPLTPGSWLIFIGLGMIGIRLLLAKRIKKWMFGQRGADPRYAKRRKEIEESKEKIMALFDVQKEITNDDVEKLLGVSHATATNYLDELEKMGSIAQHGVSGRGVFYTRNN